MDINVFFFLNVSRTSVELVMLVSNQRQDGCDRNVINNNDQFRCNRGVDQVS